MEKTWKPTAASILLIFAILISIVLTYLGILVERGGLPPPAIGLSIFYFFIFFIPVLVGAVCDFYRESCLIVLFCSFFAWILNFIVGFIILKALSSMSPWSTDWWYYPVGVIFLFFVGLGTIVLIFLSEKEFK